MTNNEPAATGGITQSLIAALLLVLVSFGVPITESQQNAILSFLAIAGPLITAWWVRRKVMPVRKVRHVVRTALAMPPDSTVADLNRQLEERS
jgi:hypothetical protein